MNMKILHREEQSEGVYSLAVRLPTGSGRVSGLDALVQLMLMHGMTTPGQDEYQREEGGGLLRAFHQFTSSGDLAQLAADVAESVARTERQVRISQVGESLPSTELLETFRLQQVTRLGRQVTVRVLLRNQAGEETTLTV